MKAVVYVETSPQDHLDSALAFKDGLQHHGIDVIRQPMNGLYYPYGEDFAVIFGINKKGVEKGRQRGGVIAALEEKGIPFIVLEKGFVRRDEYFHVGWNGLNGHANQPGEHYYPYSWAQYRWDKLGVELKPMRPDVDDSVVLLCGQVPWDATVQDTDHGDWCLRTFDHLRALSSRHVVFRPHPKASGYDYGIMVQSEVPYEEDLARAYAVVSYNSTTSALALIEGVHTFVSDRMSIAWPVAQRDLSFINDPPVISDDERQNWANRLAFQQWTANEMRNGECWEHMQWYFEDDPV